MTYEDMYRELAHLKDDGFDMQQTVTACVYSSKLDDCSTKVSFVDDETGGFGSLGVWFEDDEPQNTPLLNQKMVVQRELVEQDDKWRRRFLKMVTGHECVPCKENTLKGQGGVLGGEGMESSMSYYDCSDNLGYSVIYQWRPITDDLAEVVVVSIVRDKNYDGEFNLTREALAVELRRQFNRTNSWKDGALKNIAERFGLEFSLQ